MENPGKNKNPLAGLVEGYDRLLEHRTRLAICALLMREKRITFSHFKAVLDESDGNLGAQLRKLEDAGYVKLTKTFEGRKPVSRYTITAKGRKQFTRHLAALESLF